MQQCRGICPRYKAKKPSKGGRYATGQIRCNICGIFMNQNGMLPGYLCICCHNKVRTKPRLSEYRMILQDTQKIKRY